MKSADIKTLLIVFLITTNLGAFLLIGYLVVELSRPIPGCGSAVPQVEANAVTVTSTPQKTSTALRFSEITHKYETLTSLHWTEYADSLTGARVRWTARVVDVQPDGTLLLDPNLDSSIFLLIEDKILNHHMLLHGISEDLLSTVNKDDVIEFEARIKGFQEHTHGLFIVLGVVSITDLETFRAQHPEPTPPNSIQATNEAIEAMIEDNDQ